MTGWVSLNPFNTAFCLGAGGLQLRDSELCALLPAPCLGAQLPPLEDMLRDAVPATPSFLGSWSEVYKETSDGLSRCTDIQKVREIIDPPIFLDIFPPSTAVSTYVLACRYGRLG